MQTFIQQKMSKKHWQQKLVLLIISKPYYRQRHCRFWKKSHRKHRKRQENILETLQRSLLRYISVSYTHLHDNGVNYIRIRIWNDPTNEKGETYGGGANDVAAGLEIAKEAAQYDMKLLLDFHYSDFWADPALQKVPKAWEKDKNDTEKMKQNVYDFTKDTICLLYTSRTGK